jgi:hypothetical protein
VDSSRDVTAVKMVIYPKATVVVGVAMVEDVAADLSLLFTAVHPTGVVQNHPNRNSSSSLVFHATDPDRNYCPKAGPKPCGWCGGHRGISKRSHCEPLFEHVTHFHLVGYVIFYSLS